MKRFIVALGTLVAFMYAAFCIYTIHSMISSEREIKVKVETTTQELEKLENNYNNVNNELQKSNSDKEQLLKEKEELDKKRQELESQLQAKRENQAKIAKASEAVINTITNTKSVSAATVSGSCSSYMEQAGITDPIAHEIVNKENRNCDPCVYNDGSATGARDCNYSGDRAYGIPQSLPGNKMASAGDDWRTNPVTQLRWMQSYVIGRYGSWAAAKAHHDVNNWY